MPYRLWCKYYVMGRGRGFLQKNSAGSSITIVGHDYFYITSAGVMKREGLDYPRDLPGEAPLQAARTTGRVVKCLVLRCSNTKVVLAHVIPQNSLDEDGYVAHLVSEDISWLGNVKVILKR